jgi:large subunit ribosomal protein L4
MATLKVKNVSGKDAGTVELDDEIFAVQPNVPVMHQVVTAQLAARRSGTQSTKTRAEVRGGGRKPYAQKGTGNARQGSIRGPHFSGGGVALGPKPRKYDQKTPKKMVKLALKSALSDRANEGKIIVVDSWGIDSPKTKTAKLALDALGIDGTALVVVGRDDAAAAMSFRNLPKVQLIGPGELNAYDVLCNEYIVFTKDLVPASVVGDRAEATKPVAKKSVAEEPVTETSARQELVSEPADAESAPYGKGSHAATEDNIEPKGFPIKGNAGSMLYHGPESSHYGQTVAEVWFATEEAAEAAGFSKPASVVAAEERHPYGEGSRAANEDGSEPKGFPIKGNADSMLFHGPDSPYYSQTVAEVWFATEEAAEAAGFSKPASVAAAEDAAADESTKEGA